MSAELNAQTGDGNGIEHTRSDSHSEPSWWLWWSCASATAAFAAAGKDPSRFPGVAGALMSAP